MIISHKYEVQDQLGQGSIGVVYKVRHIALETILALRVLPTHLMGKPELVKRFYREARVMARLHHPHIARVIDIHHDDALQFHYFVMEYIQGQTLRQYLQERGALPLGEVIEITRQVARALDYAHRHNPPVIHRDIKPSNIMIEEGSRRVVVMDFGIAKELDESEMTRAGTLLGTLKYCPPEQMRHEPLDGSADVYALGMVMYEAYTGTHLLAGLGEEEVIRKGFDPQEHELAFTRGTPAEFVALVARAVAKGREKRYRRMAEFLRDLDTRGLPGEHGAITAPEAQIHKLEEERKRRLVLQLQAQVQESKEKAAREGAGRWASTLFQQGCTQEESGREHLRERHYEQAQETYQEAADLFAQACEEAITQALVQRAGQARQEMAAAKLEADQYGARERASTFYQRGLRLQAQADELWESQSYREAWQVYGGARGVFEDAHELAYQALLQEEAKAAQNQRKAARELAVKEQAEEFASETFWEAVRSEGRGDTALGQEEFTQARELYRAAVQQYELAQQQARVERQRLAAVGVQQQAQEARAKAEAVGAGPEQEAYRQAQEAQGRGEARLQGQAYEQAVQEYGRAREGYARAVQEAERARRQAVVEARARVEAGWVAAERAGARGRCAEAWAVAEQKVAQGRRSEEGEELTAALKIYEEAVQALSGLREAAEREAVWEEAEAARGRLSEAREKEVGLRGWAKAAWVRADEEAHQAEAAWQGQAYRRAVELYGRAVQAYARAEREAAEERGHQRALEARRRAEEAQRAAEEAQTHRYAQELYRGAEEAMRQGEQRFKANRWEEATNEWVKVRGLFDQSLEGAKRAKAKQAAEAARDSALVAQRKAQEGEASALFPDEVAEALALVPQAEQKLIQQDYRTAQAVFERSTALFRQVCEEAVVYLQRKQAKEAQDRAHEVQDRLSSVKRGRQQRRAHKTLVQGDRLFQQGSYAEARVKYEEAISLFSALLETSFAAPLERKIAPVARPYLYAVSILGLLSVVIVLYLALYPPYHETLPKIAEGKKALEQRDLGRFKRADADTERLDKERERAEREASIAKLLKEAHEALVGDRLTPPAGENAVELAKQVLVLEPGHQGAQQILVEVVMRYVGLGEAALSKDQLVKAKLHYITAQELVQRYQLPDSDVGRLAKRIATQEQRLAEEARREAEAKRLAEEQQRRAEAERLAEEQRRKEEKKRLAEEQRRRTQQAQKAREQARRKEKAKHPARPQPKQQEASEFAGLTEEQLQKMERLQKENERLENEKKLRSQPPPPASLIPTF